MQDVHAAVSRLVRDGIVTLSWKSAPRALGDGPYRIRRAQTGRTVKAKKKGSAA